MRTKLNHEKIEELFYKDLTDKEIAKIINSNRNSVYSVRRRLGLKRKYKLKEGIPIEITKRQEELLIGHFLGDGTLKKPNGCKNPNGKIEQGNKQKEYLEWKYKNLKNLCTDLGVKFYVRTKADKRNGSIYKSYICYLKANPNLNYYFENLYKDNKKIISNEILELYTDLSLAVHFMDDGSRYGRSYSLATHCFDLESLNRFKEFLWNKFKIDTVIHKHNILYIKAGSRRLFEEIISPHIIDSMKYKLYSTVS